MRSRRIIGTAVALLASIALGGCWLFPATEVDRLVGGAWDGNDLLVFESRYFTTHPSDPYFNVDARLWQIVILHWPNGDASAQQELGVIDEDFTAGGAIGNSRTEWDATSGIVLVADLQGPYLLRQSGDSWTRIALERPADLATHLDYADSVDGFAPLDATLSPDASTIAVLWEYAYFAPGSIYDIRLNDAVAFYRASDGAFLASWRTTGAPPAPETSIATQFGPMPIDINILPLRPYTFASDAVTWNKLVWDAAGSGVYVALKLDSVAAYVTPGSAPVQVTDIPAYSIPSDSGPVSDSGKAIVFTYGPASSQNEVAVSFTQVAGWQPFGAYGTVPIADAIGY